MTLGDLYLALVLVGVIGLAGWTLHEYVSERDDRLIELERKAGIPEPFRVPSLAEMERLARLSMLPGMQSNAPGEMQNKGEEKRSAPYA